MKSKSKKKEQDTHPEPTPPAKDETKEHASETENQVIKTEPTTSPSTTDKNHATLPLKDIPTAEYKKTGGWSLVWLIPLAALILGGWLGYDALKKRGPLITIHFQTSDGIHPGKTKVKYKSVNVGEVKAVRLSRDLSQVAVDVRFVNYMASFLSKETRFWVVRPRLSLSGVSGLNTLVSGAYIEMIPGPKSDTIQDHFQGMEDPPVITPGAHGEKFILKAEKLTSLTTGSPIYFRGVPVGEVTGYRLDENHGGITVHTFIREPYNKLVKTNTKFWNMSGVDLQVGPEGIKLDTDSFHAMLMGGIAFDVPTYMQPGKKASPEQIFTLFANNSAAEEGSFGDRIHFIMFFDDSVRGLKKGSAVEFRGIKIGSVRDIRIQLDHKNFTVKIAVVARIEPERVAKMVDDNSFTPSEELMKMLVEHGLRARLQTGNYLTGGLFIDLNFYPDTPATFMGGTTPKYPEIPTTPTRLEEIAQTASAFFSKLKQIPFESMVGDARKTLQGVRDVVNAPEVLQSIQNLNKSLISIHKILKDAQQSGQALTGTLENAKTALAQVKTTFALASGVVAPDAPLHYQIVDSLQELAKTARAVRSLSNYLERNPQALLFGKGKQGRTPDNRRPNTRQGGERR
ncbi:intermembrane transport protein PqiB [Magnetococcales bacterium HHB-1]